MALTSFEKDLKYLQQYLAARNTALYIESADTLRAERLLTHLAEAFDRLLFITLKGKGVFCRAIGRDDIPVVRGINTSVLQKLIDEHKPPELTPDEVAAIDMFKEAQQSQAANTEVDWQSIPNFPQPISVKPTTSVHMPIPVEPNKVNTVKTDLISQVEEFLVRFRIMVKGTDGDASFHPAFLDSHGNIDKQHRVVQQWNDIIGQICQQYGLESPMPNGPSPLEQGFEMLLAADPKQDIIFLMEGFKEDFNSQLGGYEIYSRAIRDLEYTVRQLIAKKSTNQFILLSTGIEFPSTVAKWLNTYALNAPDFDDIDEIVRVILARIFQTNPELYHEVISRMTEGSPTDDTFDAALKRVVDSLRGLTESQIDEVVWLSIRSQFNLIPEMLNVARNEIINRTPGLTVYETDVSFSDIGGMEPLKKWIRDRGADLFLTPQQAKEKLGGHSYKGILLIGLPGTGKSLVTKAIANYLSKKLKDTTVSLVQLDVGALRGSFVGQTEERTREALKTIEAFAPVILWIDEIEKAFSGAGGDTGSEISRRMLGTFLTWMQERKAPVFLVATANDVSALPPEFKRKGRWDATFFMPLPDKKAVSNIFNYQLRRFGLDLLNVKDRTEDSNKKLAALINYAYSGNIKGEMSAIYEFPEEHRGSGAPVEEEGEVVMRHLGYTGAEIEAAVIDAISMAKGRAGEAWHEALTLDDLLIALTSIRPISQGVAADGRTMAHLMWLLEKQGDKVRSKAQLEKSISDLTKQLQSWEISQEDIQQYVAEVEELQKVLQKNKKKKTEKNPSSPSRRTQFLLDSDEFYYYLCRSR